MADGWRPWRELRARSHIDFRLVDMPPGGPRALHIRRGGDCVILIDRSLPPAERLAALAHELVHDERGGGCHLPGAPPALRVLVEREEERVEDEVARRLVPAADLEDFIDAMLDLELGVTAAAVAERFEVPEALAQRAMQLLATERRRSA